MIVEAQTTTVYAGGGRRYLTKDAAYNAAARAKIKQRCECDEGDHITPGFTCDYHADPERYAKMKRRLARLYRAIDARTNP